MFKLILCLLIVCCSTLVGFSYSSKLYSRKRILESFVLELENAKNAVRYSNKNVFELFKNSFFGYLFLCDKPFCVQWNDMLSQFSATLTIKDIEILTKFGEVLGTSDLSGELNNFDMYISLLETQIADSTSVIEVKGKTYKVLGLSAGLVIAIILI